MKPILFCIACFMLAAFIHANAEHQMQQDLHKMQHKSYVM
jgi:hypothetical protein